MVDRKLGGAPAAEPDPDVLRDIAGEDVNDNASIVPYQGFTPGRVQYDPAGSAARIPMLKIRQPNSVDVTSPDIQLGDVSLNLEYPIQTKDKKTFLTILAYKEWYEDNVPVGQPKTTYATIAEASKAGKTLQKDQTGKANLREAALAVVLVKKPTDLVSAVFTFEHNGDFYAVARWFMNGWAVWGPGRVIKEKAGFDLKACGLVAGQWELTTERSVGGGGQPFFKPKIRLLPTRNDKAFLDWVASMTPSESPAA